MQFVRDGISGLLRELETLTGDDAVDAEYNTVAGDIADPPTPETRPRGLPAWAAGQRNMRGLIQFSRSHFYGVVAVKGPGEENPVVAEAVIDTGGSKSLIDADSAE